MAKITITLTDTENGHVKIDCDPDFPVMLKIAQSRIATPAQGYALAALNKIMKDSLEASGLMGTPRMKLN